VDTLRSLLTKGKNKSKVLSYFLVSLGGFLANLGGNVPASRP
jgi:hypothetical protein